MRITLLIALLAIGAVAETNYPPMPPIPLRTKVMPVRLTKRQEQARALREAAAVLEAEEVKELHAMELSISNAVAHVDFSTSTTAVSVKTVSFMTSGTNLLMQVTPDLREK